MANRRALLAVASLLGVQRAAHAGSDLSRIRPGIFSSGQSQAGQGGTSPPRIGPNETDTIARMPRDLLMFRANPGVNGNILEGVRRVSPRLKRPTNRLVPSQYTGFTAYRDAPDESVNAATPFLFALTARLKSRSLIPNGLFGFTCWQGGAPLNAFLPPSDPDYGNPRVADLDHDGHGDPATNYLNLVDAIARYAEFTRAEGLLPYVPLIRFEHGEGRIVPHAFGPSPEHEIVRYVAAHIRMTDRLVTDVRAITGQTAAPIVLLGGWGGRDSTTDLDSIAPEAVRRLVAIRPDRYVGPTSAPYMAPLYNDAGPSSEVHPSFLGRIIVGEAQAHVADLCLDDALRPNPTGFAPLRCLEIARVPGAAACFELRYHLPPEATGGLAVAIDDWLPPTPNHGFEYLGTDSTRVRVTGVVLAAADRVRVTLNADPADPAGQIAYGLGPRDIRWKDGTWNYRGNLVCPNAAGFHYGPILALPPYEIAMPGCQRYVAVPERVALPRANGRAASHS